MEDRLTKLRLSFPAEATGGFLAAQKLLSGPDGTSTNYDHHMKYFLIALIGVNALIYWQVYQIRSPWFLVYISLGFFLWAFAIDTARLSDLLWFDSFPTMPMLLILYTVVSTLLPLPAVRQPDPVVKAAAQ